MLKELMLVLTRIGCKYCGTMFLLELMCILVDESFGLGFTRDDYDTSDVLATLMGKGCNVSEVVLYFSIGDECGSSRVQM